MNDGTWVIFLPFALFALLLPISVWRDAVYLRRSGAKLNPALWAIFVMLPPFIGIFVYLAFRGGVWKRQIDAVDVTR